MESLTWMELRGRSRGKVEEEGEEDVLVVLVLRVFSISWSTVILT